MFAVVVPGTRFMENINKQVDQLWTARLPTNRSQSSWQSESRNQII